MIIESSTIGMQSSRSYRSVTKASASFIGGTFAGGKEGLDTLFENQLGTGEKTAGQEGNKEEAKLQDLSAHMWNMSGGWQISTKNDPQETVRSIKQQCVEFLMELLFKFHKNRGGRPVLLQLLTAPPCIRCRDIKCSVITGRRKALPFPLRVQ